MKQPIFSILCIILMLASVNSRAQDVQFDHISLTEGLSQASVTCLLQDEEGYMWIGTRDGLNRYDGYEFDVYRNSRSDSTIISNNYVTALFQDSKGFLWVGTASGLNKVDTEEFESKAYFRRINDNTSLSSGYIKSIGEDESGRLWVGTDNGLNRFDRQTETFVHFSTVEADSTSLIGNVVYDMVLDTEGNMWFGTNSGLNRWTGSGFERFRKRFDRKPGLPSNEILSFCNSGESGIWIGTDKGLVRWDLKKKSFIKLDIQLPKLSGELVVNDVLEDHAGTLWLGTNSGLVVGVESEGNYSWRIFRNSSRVYSSIPADNIVTLLEDESGLMWFGTETAGIATLNQRTLQFNSVNFPIDDGYRPGQNRVYDFQEVEENKIWLGTGEGLAIYNTKNQETVFLRDSSDHPLSNLVAPVHVIALMGDSLLWLGTSGDGLLSFHLKTQVVKKYEFRGTFNELVNHRINFILPDSYGNLWLATSGNGLVCFNSFTSSYKAYGFDITNQASVKDDNIHTLALGDSSCIWVGTGNAGLYKFNIDSGKYVFPGKDVMNIIGSVGINDLVRTKKNELWVATAGAGLFCVNRAEHVASFGRDRGLASDVVLSLVDGGAGNIWMSTNRGVSVFNTGTQLFRNFSEQNVLGRNTFFARSATRDSRGALFFGGGNGFEFSNSSSLKTNYFAPPTVITGYQVIDESNVNDQDDLVELAHDTIYVDHDHSGVTFEYAALNFQESEKNQYAYRLQGQFDKWRYVGDQRLVTFLDLEPGDYVFEVKGANNDGVWSDDTAKLHVFVKPAVWQNVWFQSFVIIALLTIVYLLFRIKVRAQNIRNQELETAVKERTKQIAEERDTNAILLKEVHHRVKNNLQIIVSLLNLQNRFIDDPQFASVFTEVQNRVRSMSMIHQKMYQTKDLQTVNLEEYINDLAGNLLWTYKLEQEIDLEVDVKVNRFNSDTLTPLGLIINEVISNALKYAFEDGKKGNIFVRIFHLGQGVRYRMIIGDNGVGMSKEEWAEHSESFGIELINALVEQLMGTIELLEDEPGTVYQVDFMDYGD